MVCFLLTLSGARSSPGGGQQIEEMAANSLSVSDIEKVHNRTRGAKSAFHSEMQERRAHVNLEVMSLFIKLDKTLRDELLSMEFINVKGEQYFHIKTIFESDIPTFQPNFPTYATFGENALDFFLVFEERCKNQILKVGEILKVPEYFYYNGKLVMNMTKDHEGDVIFTRDFDKTLESLGCKGLPVTFPGNNYMKAKQWDEFMLRAKRYEANVEEGISRLRLCNLKELIHAVELYRNFLKALKKLWNLGL
ncbi:MAG: hypothetical protein HON43_06260 [Alphaproteobacteria bacterium]|nr:hypothetical protein [Alphaproteobacteria bacterium]